MEAKINKEIRNYTESMFFRLSMRQFVFSVLVCGVAVACISCSAHGLARKLLDQANNNNFSCVPRALWYNKGRSERKRGKVWETNDR